MGVLTKVLKFLKYKTGKIKPDYSTINMGTGSIIVPGFRLDIRSKHKTNRLFVGENSVLGCSITLERDQGIVRIGNNSYIGGSHIICAQQVEIGSDVLIAWGCTIVDHDSHSLDWHQRADDVRRWKEGIMLGLDVASAYKKWESVPMKPICIKDKVWIGFNSIILKGITIGEGAVVAAASVVTKNIPDWTLVGGNPAHIIRELSGDE